LVLTWGTVGGITGELWWNFRGVAVVELLGQHRYQLDAKGRFALPKRYLEALQAGAYVTLGQDRCLWVFPPEDFERYGERIRSRPLSDANARAYGRIFFGSAERVAPDAQGRLTISPKLRVHVTSGREVVVIGVFDHLEVWEATAWERYEQENAVAYSSGALELGEA
jgi:MraZ protein